MKLLKSENWSENLQEFEDNSIQESIIEENNFEDVSLVHNLTFDHSEFVTGSNYTLEEIELKHIQSILDKSKWDIKSACDILGISRATIYRKINLYNLSREKPIIF